ncbi:DUF302 domain-containing protein [Bradyrhizobium sp. BTAi1]|uniref:DUF302 domain-containing protein n=1 Tax=Bradyrhizobium sp. (strain BTAi1 / ATCC BAA-1182) TaxID=288000 RepID=UPI00005DEBE7|nr:DUF302 domain-containing protein [Bradyrhizobium sp. BTAi1]ABQ35494.1 putative exported protein of unknown function [Bradyrhizobium sp. BTAi1]
MIRHLRAMIVSASLAVGCGAPLAHAQSTAAQAGLVTVPSANTMAETEKRLTDALDAAGLKVAARIDHSAGAKAAGLELAPTVVYIFGNPKVGTVLMQAKRTSGIDLPLKILVWEEAGTVNLTYTDPAEIARRHGIDADLPVLSQMSAAMKRITASASTKP